jgi:hypothetical protein
MSSLLPFILPYCLLRFLVRAHFTCFTCSSPPPTYDKMPNGEAIQLGFSSVSLVSAGFMLWTAFMQVTKRLHSLQLGTLTCCAIRRCRTGDNVLELPGNLIPLENGCSQGSNSVTVSHNPGQQRFIFTVLEILSRLVPKPSLIQPEWQLETESVVM